MDIRYPALLEAQAPAGWFVRFVDFDDTFTEGATQEEALWNAAEALSAMLEWKIDQGQPIPDPSPGVPEAHYIAPDAKIQAALLVRRARGDRSLADLARALDASWPVAKRLEDPHHAPTLKQLDKAAAALGKRLVLVFE
jgi:antitoxin HicB